MLNSVEQMLFESTNAKFALKINVMTTKKNTQTNQQIPLITVSQQGNARIKPNAFLVFTYMTDDYETSKHVFTSNPHMTKIKTIVRTLKDAILSGNAFVNHDNILSVNERYAKDYVVSNIGTKQHYILFKLRADAMVDMNNNFMPAVEIRLSEAPESSILSLDEFLAIYEIIEQVNLPLAAMSVGLAEIILNNSGAQQRPATTFNNTRNASQGYKRAYSTPNQAQPPVVQTTYAPKNPDNGSEYYTQTAFQPKQVSQQPYTPRQQLAPKAPEVQQKGPSIMSNRAAIEDIEVEDLDLGDTGLNDIFNDDGE